MAAIDRSRAPRAVGAGSPAALAVPAARPQGEGDEEDEEQREEEPEERTRTRSPSRPARRRRGRRPSRPRRCRRRPRTWPGSRRADRRPRRRCRRRGRRTGRAGSRPSDSRPLVFRLQCWLRRSWAEHPAGRCTDREGTMEKPRTRPRRTHFRTRSRGSDTVELTWRRQIDPRLFRSPSSTTSRPRRAPSDGATSPRRIAGAVSAGVSIAVSELIAGLDPGSPLARHRDGDPGHRSPAPGRQGLRRQPLRHERQARPQRLHPRRRPRHRRRDRHRRQP